MRAILAALACTLIVGGCPEAHASGWLIPPVDGPVSRGFEAPAARWTSGHRGIDYQVPPGARIRASGDGTVTFSGRVPRGLALTIDHGEGLQTTYTLLARTYVSDGQVVAQGQWIGAAGAAHPGRAGGLHFGVRLNGSYADPADFLGASDMSNAIHLVPTSEQAHPGPPSLTRQVEGSTVACTPAGDSGGWARAPNDNAVVVIGGINSEWDADSLPKAFALPARLGYPASKTYRFSYAGPRAASYDRTATYGDLRVAGARLDALLRRIGRAHPGASVDVLAHSQGGLVAREYLKGWAHSWDPARPQVEHLVTLATPHQGAPLAAEVTDLDDRTITGATVMDLLTRFDHLDVGVVPVTLMPLARAAEALENLVPDPRAAAVDQMVEGSAYLRRLSSEDVAYGTRVLALQAPWDLAVPADHARFPGELNRVVRAALPEQHTSILSSPDALGLAHAFLRDAAEPCLLPDDEVGWATGREVSAATSGLDHAYAAAESAVLARVLKPALTGVSPIRSGLTGATGAYRAWRGGGVGGLHRWARARALDAALSGVGWYYDRTVQGIVGRVLKEGLQRLRPGT